MNTNTKPLGATIGTIVAIIGMYRAYNGLGSQFSTTTFWILLAIFALILLFGFSGLFSFSNDFYLNVEEVYKKIILAFDRAVKAIYGSWILYVVFMLSIGWNDLEAGESTKYFIWIGCMLVHLIGTIVFSSYVKKASQSTK